MRQTEVGKMQNTRQINRWVIVGEVVRAVIGVILFILLVGLWVSLWVPLVPLR
ncbi:MAG: hypothetical protein JXM73_17535 [Anaerolineae bacterium]|nr:hypothetical protein [Anaerolineae bacterium]